MKPSTVWRDNCRDWRDNCRDAREALAGINARDFPRRCKNFNDPFDPETWWCDAIIALAARVMAYRRIDPSVAIITVFEASEHLSRDELYMAEQVAKNLLGLAEGPWRAHVEAVPGKTFRRGV